MYITVSNLQLQNSVLPVANGSNMPFGNVRIKMYSKERVSRDMNEGDTKNDIIGL